MNILYSFFVKAISFSNIAHADGVISPEVNTSIKLPNPAGFDNVTDVMDRLISYLTQLAAPILVIMVLVGAFYMLTAGDNEAKFTKGKKTITYAAIGFAIILVSNGLVFIIKEFLRV